MHTQSTVRCKHHARWGVVLVASLFGHAEVAHGDSLEALRDRLTEANHTEDTTAGFEKVRAAVVALGQLPTSAERDALLGPAEEFAEAVTIFTGRQQGEGLPGEKRRQMILQLASVPPDHPLYLRACLHLGRYYYWRGRQDGRKENYDRSRTYFDKVKGPFGHERLVKIYTGERLVWPTKYDSGVVGAPEWAIKQREALCRVIEVIHYWINERQAADGSLGCGWGDDVEILRTWPVAILGADDALTRTGMRRLVEGVWYSGAIDRERGFASRLSDVEHSAEPTADSQPMMILFEPGAPRYVERNLLSMKRMAEQWTGINPNGHRLFRSSWFSATELDTTKGRDVCSPYCVRAAKAGHWLAWYGRYPEITKLFAEWMDAWVAAAESTARGKPKGVLPASIRFSDEQFGGSGPSWHDSGLGKLYTFPVALTLMFEQLITTYALTGDDKYLRPLLAAADLVIARERRDTAGRSKPGSAMWAAGRMRGALVGSLSKWRMLTGDTRYDAFLGLAGSPYMRYRLTGDVAPLIAACQASIESTGINRELVTTEVRWTDRVAVRGTDTLLAMYTGHVGHQGYWPLHAVTWHGTGPDFAALVREADERSVNVLAFSFDAQPRSVSMSLWRFRDPGTYRLRVFEGERPEGDPVEEWTLDWRRRGDRAEFTLPARKLVTILVDPVKVEPMGPEEEAHDLAVGAGDVRIVELPDKRGRAVDVTIHNLSTERAQGAIVSIAMVHSGGRTNELQRVEVPKAVNGVVGLTPDSTEVTLPVSLSIGHFRVSVVAPGADSNPANNTVDVIVDANLNVRPAPSPGN